MVNVLRTEGKRPVVFLFSFRNLFVCQLKHNAGVAGSGIGWRTWLRGGRFNAKRAARILTFLEITLRLWLAEPIYRRRRGWAVRLGSTNRRWRWNLRRKFRWRQQARRSRVMRLGDSVASAEHPPNSVRSFARTAVSISKPENRWSPKQADPLPLHRDFHQHRVRRAAGRPAKRNGASAGFWACCFCSA